MKLEKHEEQWILNEIANNISHANKANDKYKNYFKGRALGIVDCLYLLNYERYSELYDIVKKLDREKLYHNFKI